MHFASAIGESVAYRNDNPTPAIKLLKANRYSILLI
jgi:hypothetical protein